MKASWIFSFFGCVIVFAIFFFIIGSEPFLPIFLIDGKVVHFPIVCDFRHRVTRIREMDGVANLSIGGMEWCDAKVSAEIALGGEVFTPVEILTEDVLA